MNYRDYKEDQLVSQITAWLAQGSVQRLGQVLIELCEHPQCGGHPEKWGK